MNEILLGVAAFLVTYLIHSICMGGAVVVAQMTRRLGSGTMETLWRAALVAPVFTAALSLNFSVTPLTGSIELAMERMETASLANVEAPAPSRWPVVVGPERNSPETRARQAHSGPATASTSDDPFASEKRGRAPETRASRAYSGLLTTLAVVAALWFGVALVLGARWLRGARNGRSLLADRRRLRDGRVHSMLAGLAARAKIAVPALSVSERISGPAALPSGEICIPAWALDLPPHQLRALLAHELAHVERRDPWWLALAVAIESVFWLQPLNRVARRRLAALAELQADARGAQLIGDGRALADCLAYCAERMNRGPMPVLTAAMAWRGGALSERVSRLVSGTLDSGGIPMSRKIMIFAGAVALVTVLPSVAVLANKTVSVERGTSMETHETDRGIRTMSLSVSENDFRLRLEASGDFVFTPDDSGLEHMGEGARLLVEHEESGTKRKLVAKGTGDGIDYQYFVNGEAQPYSEEAQQWFAKILPQVLRESAINAPERVGYILAERGHEGVLEEIGLIRSDHARRVYIEAYGATGKLPGNAYHGLLDEAAKIGSDFEQRLALISIYGSQSPRRADLAELIAVAEGIQSDFEVRQFLSILAEDAVSDENVLVAYAKAVKTIQSDFELRQALEALLESGDNPTAVEMALAISPRIASDFEQRQLLEKAAPAAARNENLADVWLEVTVTIGSDFELSQALQELIEQDPDSTAVWEAILETARNISSDHECARFLIKAAGRMPGDPDVKAAFDAAMETIGSDAEYRRVATALGR